MLLSELTHAQLTDIVRRTYQPDVARADVELLMIVGRLWGADAATIALRGRVATWRTFHARRLASRTAGMSYCGRSMTFLPAAAASNASAASRG